MRVTTRSRQVVEGVPEGGETKAAAAAAAGSSAAARSAGLGALSAASGGRERRLAGRESNVLVVGGSDEAARSVVALLEKLGVFMVVDDRGTNDVHAEEMGAGRPWCDRAGGHARRQLRAAVGAGTSRGTVTKMARFGRHAAAGQSGRAAAAGGGG